MIKLLTVVMLQFVGMTASAQGTWNVVITEADELKGVKGGESYRFSLDSVGFIEIADWKKDRIKITTYDGEFVYSKKEMVNPLTNIYNMVCFSEVFLGLYNREGALLKKIYGRGYIDGEVPKSLIVVGGFFSQTRQIKHMLKTVQTGSGSLRIVIMREKMPCFDIKTTPYINK